MCRVQEHERKHRGKCVSVFYPCVLTILKKGLLERLHAGKERCGKSSGTHKDAMTLRFVNRGRKNMRFKQHLKTTRDAMAVV